MTHLTHRNGSQIGHQCAKNWMGAMGTFAYEKGHKGAKWAIRIREAHLMFTVK